jgi:hypothetical protein
VPDHGELAQERAKTVERRRKIPLDASISMNFWKGKRIFSIGGLSDSLSVFVISALPTHA